MALATIADYELITGTTVARGDQARVTELLDVASEQLLDHAHGQQLVAGTTEAVLRPVDGVIRFPQRPVVAVASVTVNGSELVADTDYRWTAGGDGEHAYLIRRRDGYDVSWAVDEIEVDVEWDHGFYNDDDPPVEVLPRKVVAAVVAMVFAVMRTPDADLDVKSRSKTIGGYQVAEQYTDGRGDIMRVPGPAISMLDRLCGVPGPVSARMVRSP